MCCNKLERDAFVKAGIRQGCMALSVQRQSVLCNVSAEEYVFWVGGAAAVMATVLLFTVLYNIQIYRDTQ